MKMGMLQGRGDGSRGEKHCWRIRFGGKKRTASFFCAQELEEEKKEGGISRMTLAAGQGKKKRLAN